MTPYKTAKYLFAGVIGLGYNTFILYPRPTTLPKRYLRFYRCQCHGPYTIDKTGKVLCLIFAVFNTATDNSCIDVSFYFPIHCIYFRFSKWWPYAILKFSYFRTIILSKIQITVYIYYFDMQNLVKIG